MKEITRIHLAKTPFSVEVDAKKSLEKYLNLIQKNMHAEPEAMREIEARMVELLAERGVSKDGVISHDDVLAVQKQMGEPRDFSDDDEAVDEAHDNNANDRPVKQLMRDTEHGLIGGVCAGIAAYFGINPLWVRLIAIISPFMSFGTAVLVYVVLWLSIPEARTASDKLRMRGEPITLDSLKQLTIDDNTKIQATNVAAKIFRVLFGAMLACVAFGLLVAVLVGGVFGFSVVESMSGFVAQSWAWGLLICLIFGGVALLSLTLLATWCVFAWRVRRPMAIAMIALLLFGAVSLSGVAIFSANTYSNLSRDYERLVKVKTIDLTNVAAGAKSIVFDGHGEYVAAEYGGYSDKVRLEVRYYDTKYANMPEIKVSRVGDKLIVNVQHQAFDQCSKVFVPDFRCRHTFGPESIKIYGPTNLLAQEYAND